MTCSDVNMNWNTAWPKSSPVLPMESLLQFLLYLPLLAPFLLLFSCALEENRHEPDSSE